MNIHQAARLLGGEVSAGQVLAPGPSHSATDQSLAIRFNADGEPIVHSHAGDDQLACKEARHG